MRGPIIVHVALAGPDGGAKVDILLPDRGGDWKGTVDRLMAMVERAIFLPPSVGRQVRTIASRIETEATGEGRISMIGIEAASVSWWPVPT